MYVISPLGVFLLFGLCNMRVDSQIWIVYLNYAVLLYVEQL